ncbi:hypothetical protein JVT61DRAFT_3451 [Boletus reticuloceps]|uniref:DUF6533 domain-containing protein n=1 Tax=Boletus reticuloceps TaxID=495285 RepID=A0A8I2YP04_9AGAM|nr:hypothetical protein JVT61DRAFT_3451 [Boletus reticuloceps]
MGDSVVTDNSSVWFPTIAAIQLANWCDAAAVALVCYDSILMFQREVEYVWRRRWSFMSTFYVIVRYLGIALALNFWAFNANISMAPSVSVAVDRFANFGAFVDEVVGNMIMAMRVYAMYLGSKIILVILVVMILTRIGLGLAVVVVILGPQSGISATEHIVSGIYVCGIYINTTTSSLAFAWDILTIVIDSLFFFLAVGRFIKHALDMRRMLHEWKVSDLMGVLVRDSIVYFFLNLLVTILLMISVWGPGNSSYFGIVTAYTQNEASVLIPRLVISFRENYDENGQSSRHDGDGETAHWSVRSEKMVFERHAMTDDFEVETVDHASPLACVEELT